MSVKVAIPAMLLLMVCACQNDTLEQGVPQLVVEAEPSPSQTRLQEPEGLDLGDIPLSSITVASFRLENRSTYALTDLEARSSNLRGRSNCLNNSDKFRGWRSLRAEVLGESTTRREVLRL